MIRPKTERYFVHNFSQPIKEKINCGNPVAPELNADSENELT